MASIKYFNKTKWGAVIWFDQWEGCYNLVDLVWSDSPRFRKNRCAKTARAKISLFVRSVLLAGSRSRTHTHTHTLFGGRQALLCMYYLARKIYSVLILEPNITVVAVKWVSPLFKYLVWNFPFLSVPLCLLHTACKFLFLTRIAMKFLQKPGWRWWN